MKSCLKNIIFLVTLFNLGIGYLAQGAPTHVSTIQEEEMSDETYSEPRGWVATPFLQYSAMNPSSLNNYNSAFAKKYGVNSSYEMGGTAGFGMMADYYFLPSFALGARLEYFESATKAVAIRMGDKKANVQSTLSAMPAYLTLSYAEPLDYDLEVGAVFGAGVPLSYTFATEYSASAIDGVPNGTSSYGATPFTWMLQGLGRYFFTQNMAVQLGVGYRKLSSQQLKARESWGRTVKEGDVLRDEESGAPLSVDASGFVSSVGLSVTF